MWVVAHEKLSFIPCNGMSKTAVSDPYSLLPTFQHAFAFLISILHPTSSDEHLSLLEPDMCNQLLQTALACTILIQTASSQIACASLTDLRCCRDRKGQSCTVEFLEVDIMGTCLNPFGVSHPITTIPRDGPDFRHLKSREATVWQATY